MTYPVLLLHKSLSLLHMIAADRGETSLPKIAEQAGVPASTAHRLVAVMIEEGMLVRAARGRYVVGPVAQSMADRRGLNRLIMLLGVPIVEKLAQETKKIIHIGVFERDMVTYLVKSGSRGEELFTRVGMSLEAYCSALGKVLLAHLPEEECDKYIMNGPFVPLTANTIVDPAQMRKELYRIRQAGYATDDREIAPDLRCVAVPIMDNDGNVVAGLSLSDNIADASVDGLLDYVAMLKRDSEAIQAALFPSRRTTYINPMGGRLPLRVAHDNRVAAEAR